MIVTILALSYAQPIGSNMAHKYCVYLALRTCNVIATTRRVC